MDPFSFKAGLEQQAANEFVAIAHAPIFRTLGRSFRWMVWNLIRSVQIAILLIARSLRERQMNEVA